MTQILEATFDGVVLHPNEPLQLEPNTRVRLVIETLPPVAQPKSFLQTARELKFDGLKDWSSDLDDYLYGEKS